MKPNENDILSGRGASFNQHPGNAQFRKMIDNQKVRLSQYFPFCPIIDDFYGRSYRVIRDLKFQLTARYENI